MSYYDHPCYKHDCTRPDCEDHAAADRVPERLRDYDWQEVFKYANGGGVGATPTACQGYAGSLEPFSRRDVAEVIAAVDGENDGADWVGLFRLHDGRFAYVQAGCDYTGWG